MDKIRTVIADDEPLARRGIRQLLVAHHDIVVVAEARNGCETVRALRELKPELVFLDVQMPELDGFGVLREIGPKVMPAVVFVTAYDQFAVKAFDAQALDYLIKPLEESRFGAALDRVRLRLRSDKAFDLSKKLSALLAKHERERAGQRILVSTATGDFVIDAQEIEWIEADDYYAAIHRRQERYLIRESLASLEHRLDRNRFVRTHRSAIVNLDRVKAVHRERGETVLVLEGGTKIPVSRRRRARVSQLLHLHVK